MKKFKENEQEIFDVLTSPYLKNDMVLLMGNYTQHGGTSTLDHCYKVARAGFLLNRRLGLKIDENELVTASILHDFNLYNWRDKDDTHKWHGFRHPDIAADNAITYCHIDSREESAIRTHMWPLTITKFPQNRSAWIICVTDKYCAICELFRSIQAMSRRQYARYAS